MSAGNNTNFSDELSELIRTDAEVDDTFYTESAEIDNEEITRIKTDILTILRLMNKLEKDIKRLKEKSSILGGKSADKLLNQLVGQMERKANRSDLQVLDTRLDQFDEFLKGSTTDSEGQEVTNLQKYVKRVIQDELSGFTEDIRKDIKRIKNYLR